MALSLETCPRCGEELLRESWGAQAHDLAHEFVDLREAILAEVTPPLRWLLRKLWRIR
jgi:hypothetical protein